jgi:dihydrofolate reductase
MRKLVILSFVSLDGVMQAPGGPEEDTTDGFKYGGWTVPFFDDASGEIMGKQLNMEYDLLLGRKTYDLFATYWPAQGDNDVFKAVKTKYFVSNNSSPKGWEGSVQIKGDAAKEIRKLKETDGPMLQVHGSGELIQTLLEHDLADELWLKIYPVTLGKGKRLFGSGTRPAAFKLTESVVTPSGVYYGNYRRDGDVKTGSFAEAPDLNKK